MRSKSNDRNTYKVTLWMRPQAGVYGGADRPRSFMAYLSNASVKKLGTEMDKLLASDAITDHDIRFMPVLPLRQCLDVAKALRKYGKKR